MFPRLGYIGNSKPVLNTSREGDFTTPMGRLFYCSVTLIVKKFLLMFGWIFLCSSLCPVAGHH